LLLNESRGGAPWGLGAWGRGPGLRATGAGGNADVSLLLIAIAVALGLYMAWGIGANDVANSMGDAVGAGAISFKWALVAAAICEFAGASLVGAHVTDTIRKEIVSPDIFAATPEVLVLGMACSLLAAAVWLHVATWLGMPVSTTHSIVGAVVGFGVVAAGWGAVRWSQMVQIVASWVLSPLAGAAVAFVVATVIDRLILHSKAPARDAERVAPFVVFAAVFVVALSTLHGGLQHTVIGRAGWLTGSVALWTSLGLGGAGAAVTAAFARRFLRGGHATPVPEQLARIQQLFAPVLVMTSCSVAFAHGANDVANAVGPLAAVYDIASSGTVKMRVLVPGWVLATGGCGIVLGLFTYGRHVMETVGKKITPIIPSRGVAADIAVTATVLACTRLKLPVSTTHTLVGAIIGIGLARGAAVIDLKVTRNIFASWFVTVPAAAALAAVLFLLGRVFVLESIAEVIGFASAAR